MPDQFILKNVIYVKNRLGRLDITREAIMNAIYYADALQERVDSISLSSETKETLRINYDNLADIIREIDIAKRKFKDA